MLDNSLVPQTVRNYIMVSATVVFMSVGLTDLFYNPQRMGQQDRINNYSDYAKAGMVFTTRSSLKGLK